MARLARVVIPGCAHHVVEHARPGVILFRDEVDFSHYRDLLERNAASSAVTISAWCLLPDHVHLLLSPQTHEGLARMVGETHRLYARHRGLGASALWAGRFRSCPVAPGLEAACAAYIESNPARLALDAWAWASARAGPHAPGQAAIDLIRTAIRTGRPVGPADFIVKVEYETGRRLMPRRRGRKPKW